MTITMAIVTALWLGILTSISPCPLAGNVAAISFLDRRVDRPAQAVFSGLLYTLGRATAYAALAALLMAGLLGSDLVSRFLQRYLNQVLGPVLILAGMLLLGLIGSTVSLNLAGESMQRRASQGGAGWACLLGFLFALSFCPVSAGLFFGGLLTLAAAQRSQWLLPSLYGVGTALPVISFAFLIALAANRVGTAFNRLAQLERWIRRITGTVFVLVGIHYCIGHIYGFSIF